MLVAKITLLVIQIKANSKLLLSVLLQLQLSMRSVEILLQRKQPTVLTRQNGARLSVTEVL